ncbi:MAG TPA: hypothetical protein VF017_23355 [Thermoanaerobaculia bacterium]|nr:hypothetical protein [Thermoanaerobaculia bacterium]
MHYPGNSALAPDVQQRIVRTFQQTLELAEKGSAQEAILGCDFILRMDPQFEAARVLMNRIGATPGAVSVEDLRRMLQDPAARPAVPAAPATLPDLDFDTELPDLPELSPEPSGRSALTEGLRQLLERGELKRLIQVAEENRREVAADADARRIVEQAYNRLEAEPYVLSYLEKARQARAGGDLGEVERMLARARSLDAHHPGILELERELAGPVAPPAVASGAGVAGDAVELELEPQGGFSLDFAASAPAPQWGAPVASGGGQETDGRIRELLDEGQAAFARGDHQAAIDTWSRIFLIDIDHQEAARRIEQARRVKAEGERKVEEVFHEAVNAFELGFRDEARQGLERVLAIQPGHFGARDYLNRLEEEPAESFAPPAAVPPRPGGGGELLEEDLFLKEDIFEPPPPGEAPRAAAQPKATAAATGARPAAKPAARASSGRGRFFLVGGAVLALLLAVSYLAWNNWDRLFPNAAPAAEGDLLAQAKEQYERGKQAAARSILGRIPEGDPQYEEAQELLANWQAGKGQPRTRRPAGGKAMELPPLPETANPPADPNLRDRWDREVARAREAYAEREYLLADRHFQRAAQVAPLAGTAAELSRDVRRQLAPLGEMITRFERRDWEPILLPLSEMRKLDSTDRDVARLLADTHYNLAVRDLQAGAPAAALPRFDEALRLRPDSVAIRRHKAFAQTYAERPPDLLYQIYVKYLPFR